MWGLNRVLRNRNFSQEHKILVYLQTKRHASNYELGKICQRFGARIHTLRKEGHLIETVQVKRGYFEYYYIGESCPQEK